MSKYHIALSFAGEDREYVEKVAAQLRSDGVSVFYDYYEEAELWGKDLYQHLSNIYRNMAMYTIVFVSAAYRDKLWTKHEMKSAQARAFMESREYILPAIFDESVDISGLLPTTGRVKLKNKTPEQLSDLIIQKLEKSGVILRRLHAYSESAKADVDFPIAKNGEVGEILRRLKSHTWSVQSPAITMLLNLDWTNISPDETFVLGRNLYQSACGGEREAISTLNKLRSVLATFPENHAIDFLNGMFFEVYFNSTGEFRGRNIKSHYLDRLLALQEAKKYEPSITFIRRALAPYRSSLFFLPSSTPEVVTVDITIKRSNPPTVKAMQIGDKTLITNNPDSADLATSLWRISYQEFSAKGLHECMAKEWGIPAKQLLINVDQPLEPKERLRLPEGSHIIWPVNP